MHELLTAEAEATMIQRAKDGDPGAINDLIAYYEPRLHALAMRTLRAGGNLEDRVQSARIAFWKAIPLFTPEKDTSFWTYASASALGDLRGEQEEHQAVVLPGPVLALRSRFRSIQRRLTRELRREPTIEEIARLAGTTAAEVSRLLKLNSVSLVEDDPGIVTEPAEPSEANGDEGPHIPDDELRRRKAEDRYSDSLAALPTERHRRLFALRYGQAFAGKPPLTLEHAAREVGFKNVEDAKAFETEALDILRSAGLISWKMV